MITWNKNLDHIICNASKYKKCILRFYVVENKIEIKFLMIRLVELRNGHFFIYTFLLYIGLTLFIWTFYISRIDSRHTDQSNWLKILKFYSLLSFLLLKLCSSFSVSSFHSEYIINVFNFSEIKRYFTRYLAHIFIIARAI